MAAIDSIDAQREQFIQSADNSLRIMQHVFDYALRVLRNVFRSWERYGPRFVQRSKHVPARNVLDSAAWHAPIPKFAKMDRNAGSAPIRIFRYGLAYLSQ
jgi:hypothetical protein